MSKINILSEETIGKIAAGEVVERPASCVKELVENSIDAGADSIDVEIEGAGQSLIRIADNGEGLNKEDALKAFKRHSTSKISDALGLNNISTLGFRGEALSSIAAVSQVDFISRSEDEDTGVYVYLESGEILKSRPAGRSRGTTIEVRNLFYNVPARKKFLKQEATELFEIVNVVGRCILAHVDKEFKLTQSGRVLLHATKDMGMLDRVKMVLGGDTADNMVNVKGEDDAYRVQGIVSCPSNTRKDKRGQVFFVNGRFVKSKILSDALFGAYHSMLERGRYPSAVIFLTVPYDEIDVNVHPAKLQVKFENEKVVKEIIAKSVRASFEEAKKENPLDVYGFTKSDAGASDEMPLLTPDPDFQSEFLYPAEGAIRSETTASDLDTFFIQKGETFLGREDLFQIGDCYIVKISSVSVVVTDQHAAHERILYEIFSKASDDNPVEVQGLLFPIRLDLSASETMLMQKLIDPFQILGFQIEPFGDKSFVVQAVPAALKDRDIKTVLYDILSDMASSKISKSNMLDELIKMASCKAAIKSGQKLATEEMTTLLAQLKTCDLPFTCPHGRPTVIEITVDELEKRFRRV